MTPRTRQNDRPDRRTVVHKGSHGDLDVEVTRCRFDDEEFGDAEWWDWDVVRIMNPSTGDWEPVANGVSWDSEAEARACAEAIVAVVSSPTDA